MTKLAEASRCSSANPEGTLVNSKKLCGSQSRKSGQRIASFDKASKKPIGTLVTTMGELNNFQGVAPDHRSSAPGCAPKQKRINISDLTQAMLGRQRGPNSLLKTEHCDRPIVSDLLWLVVFRRTCHTPKSSDRF